MVSSSWLRVAVSSSIVLSLLFPLSFGFSFPQPGPGRQVSPSYQGWKTYCPERCSVSGSDYLNWTVYHNLDQLRSCEETVFYHFSLYDAVDDAQTRHRIYACTSFGLDWDNLGNATTPKVAVQQTRQNSTYQIGWWPEEKPRSRLAEADLRSLTRQMRQYFASGYGPTNHSALLFARSGKAALGLYIGKGLQNEGSSTFALKAMQDNLHLLGDMDTGGSVAMQFCEPGSNGDHVFGLMATSNSTFAPVQEAIKSWSKAQCLSFASDSAKNMTGPAFFTTTPLVVPLVVPLNNGTNSTNTNSTSSSSSSFRLLRRIKKQLSPRADCRTIQVVAGDGCWALAEACKITQVKLKEYNKAADFCETLQPGQHVCCSEGTLPDFSPKPNPDGSCATATVNAGNSCAGIAAANSLTVDKLISFNKNTWAFNGCDNIWVGTVICISTGTPPMPAPVANAVCGPQVPGTVKPPAGVDIATLNPCPLNACCNVWGQCGTTADFCTNTTTGAPGTAAPGTHGCISNCGTQIVRSDPPAVFRSIGYFQGYNLNRECLFQDVKQINLARYTHIHFGFGMLTHDYQVHMGDKLTEYEFDRFKRLVVGPKKILAFGGWDFSALPATYTIFRQGVQPANRLRLATNIANYIKLHNLDGVDIDWEYPAAPDIPGIPADDPKNGDNYLAFLVILKNLLPGKSVSIAAPASYWYLKGFPIARISRVVDYIVYMTYDLHGQWDAGNKWSQPGCASGMCLRSHVNLTETINALVMITKAGVPSHQVVVGVTTYGRSFGMADGNCFGENCFYTGSAQVSTAKKGRCTATGGYISEAEIKEIIGTNRVNQNFIDPQSNTNILVYDGNQYVGWMSPQVKASRTMIYRALNMGGTTDWAMDLENFHPDPPQGAATRSWLDFKSTIHLGGDPSRPRTGNWTTVKCTDPAVTDLDKLWPEQRWSGVDAPTAWSDLMNIWKNEDRPNPYTNLSSFLFTNSVSHSLHGPEGVNCGDVGRGNGCEQPLQCHDFVGDGTGPAGYFIWNSMVRVHTLYVRLYEGIRDASALIIDHSMPAFMDTFAPVPEDDNTELQILLNFVGLGLTMGSGAFIKGFLAKLPYFVTRPDSVGTLKDTNFAFIATGIAVAKDLADRKGASGIWEPETQREFQHKMGQWVFAWSNATARAAQAMFNGEDSNIDKLTSLISDGKFISGKGVDIPDLGSTISDLTASIARSFWAFAIPAVWAASSSHAFVLASGYPCGTHDPVGQYIAPDVQEKTFGCYDGQLYYLVAPIGNSVECQIDNGPCGPAKFSKPPGLDSLDGQEWGGVTVQDLIQGSVRTWLANQGQNGGPVADPSSSAGTRDALIDQDITTPGYVRLPVCNGDKAYKAWNRKGGPDFREDNYPCSFPVGKDFCSPSDPFIDQTSGASPLVSDCLQLATNLRDADEAGDWGKPVVGQHRIESWGTCAFGVTAVGVDGNAQFWVGNGDINEIIQESVKRFGGSGRVGSKGWFDCPGNIKTQRVEWGLYHM